MTDSNTDSGLPAGSVEQPTQPDSAGAGDQPHSSVDVKGLETALRELQGQVRALQSDKDRGVHEVKGQIKDLMKQFEWVEKAKARGLSPDEIEEQLELKALLQERRQGKSLPSSPDEAGGTRPQVASANTTSLLSDLKLDANDEQVVEAMRLPLPEMLVKLGQLSNQKQAQAQPKREPNPAGIMPSGGGQSVPVENLETLTAELELLLRDPVKNRVKIKEVSAKQRALLPTK